MSTRLLKRRSSASDHRQSTAAPGKENADSNVIAKKRSRTTTTTQKDGKIGIGENLDANLTKSCETPKSEANKIPERLTCPPAPKKSIRRVQVLSCKRKLMAEFEFFEADRREEVDEFFRSGFERISAARGRNVVVPASASAVESESSSSSSPPLTCN